MKVTLLTFCSLLLPSVNAGWTFTYGFGSHVLTGNGNADCTPITNFLADEDFSWSVSGLSSMFCCLTLYIDSNCVHKLLQACSSETETAYEDVGSYKVTGCVALTSTVASTFSGTSTRSVPSTTTARWWADRGLWIGSYLVSGQFLPMRYRNPYIHRSAHRDNKFLKQVH